MQPAIQLYDYSAAELTALLAGWGIHSSHAARLWKYLYRDGASDPQEMPELPSRLRERIAALATPVVLRPVRTVGAADSLAEKFLLELADGQRIETVLMRYRGRVTACVSSQAGCALGCVFCATGQQGFGRNLTTGEIVAQAMHVHRLDRLRNVVFMGMGEPLLNYDAVLKALEILRHPAGLAIGHKRLTLSTVGIVPGIVRLADEGQPYSLAVSLHAATQDERARMIPVAKTWPLDELVEACRYFTAKLGRRIFFEWTLIAGTNDSPDQARTLGRLLRGMPAHVNLIPLNPTAGFAGEAADVPAAHRFQEILRESGLPSTVRQRRGIEIAAGCGQLAVFREGGCDTLLDGGFQSGCGRGLAHQANDCVQRVEQQTLSPDRVAAERASRRSDFN